MCHHWGPADVIPVHPELALLYTYQDTEGAFDGGVDGVGELASNGWEVIRH